MLYLIIWKDNYKIWQKTVCLEFLLWFLKIWIFEKPRLTFIYSGVLASTGRTDLNANSMTNPLNSWCAFLLGWSRAWRHLWLGRQHLMCWVPMIPISKIRISAPPPSPIHEKFKNLEEKQINLIEESNKNYRCNQCDFTTYYKQAQNLCIDASNEQR